MKPLQGILVATDFSDCARAAAEVAAQLARQLGASVDVVAVIELPPLAEVREGAGHPHPLQHIDETRKQGRQNAEAFVAQQLADSGPVGVFVREGDPCAEILKAAEELGSDLIVMGTHGRTGLAHLVLGSIAEKVVRGSKIPVVTVRHSG